MARYYYDLVTDMTMPDMTMTWPDSRLRYDYVGRIVVSDGQRQDPRDALLIYPSLI